MYYLFLRMHDSASMLLFKKSTYIDMRAAIYSKKFKEVRGQQSTGSWNHQAWHPDKML